MKKKILLSFIGLMIISLSYSQNKEMKNHEEILRSQLETNLKDLNCNIKDDIYKKILQASSITSMDASLKSGQATEQRQRLDSTINSSFDELTSEWKYSDKTEYSYDEKLNDTLRIQYLWIQNPGIWKNLGKNTFDYDQHNNLLQYAYYSWKDTTGWILGLKENYTYDINGNKTQYIQQHWNTTLGMRIGYTKMEYSYDGNEGIILKEESTWNEDSSKWVNHYRTEYSYNSIGKESQNIKYLWNNDSNKWVLNLKQENSYDLNGSILQYYTYYWNPDSSKWSYYLKNDYNYDAGMNTGYISYSWDADSGKWISSTSEEYVYDENEKIISKIIQFGPVKFESTFDENGNILISVASMWDNVFGQWKISSKEENLYNENGVENKYYYYNWDNVSEKWDTVQMKDFYYTEVEITNIQNIKNEFSVLYPNPVSEYLNIKLIDNISKVTFELYDLQGHMIKTKEVENGERINLEHLNTGMYLYKIHADGKKQNGILMKR